MLKFQHTLLLFTLLFILISCSSVSDQADYIITGNNIWTGAENSPTVEAIAVKGDRILAAGTINEIDFFRGNNTHVIQAGDGLVIPGFIDNHTHFNRAGELLMGINLLDVSDSELLRERVAETSERLPDGMWMTGGMWGAYEQWAMGDTGSERAENELWKPHQNDINDLTPETPVLLHRWDREMYLANKVVLNLANIECGQVGVECENDEPTGILYPAAAQKALDMIPSHTLEQRIAEAHLALERLAQHGVTTIHDITGPEQMRVFQELHRRGELTTRINARPTLDKWEQLAEVGIEHGYGDEWLRIGGLKGFVDGIMGNSSARFYEPYLTTGEVGIWRPMMYPPGNMKELIVNADAHGLWPHVHAIGDQAVDSLLTLFEHAVEVNGERERRFRMIHTQVLRNGDVADRLADMNIIAEMQPYHAIDDMRWMEERIGERSRWAYAFKTLHDAGVMLSFGSDWPGTNASWYPASAIQGIYAAVTRQTLDGQPDGGWFPEERIDVETALRAYTVNNAYAAGEEDFKGTLEPGKVADIVILSENLFDIDPTEIKDVHVLYTFTGGKLVHRHEESE
ncbi:MAG: amidohydrolase [Balneolaceae bacterium]|nr:MAG: amidohydrolase [Balneolaceae bacterium]